MMLQLVSSQILLCWRLIHLAPTIRRYVPTSSQNPKKKNLVMIIDNRKLILLHLQFPYISSTSSKRDFKNDDLVDTWQSRRQLKSLKTSDSHVLGLTSCADEKAIGWSSKALDQDLEHICWKENSRKKHQAPFCLNKRESLSAL